MLKKLQKNNEGFTIIEVMIVLAIAGLILLIVFLAIPALQRNSRNTQRKNDAGALSAAYSEYVNNHGGKSPGAPDDVTNNAKLGFYTTSGAVTLTTLASTTTTFPAAPDNDSVVILVNAKCDPQGTYSRTPGTGNSVSYSSRGGVILYTVEGSTDTTTCTSAG